MAGSTLAIGVMAVATALAAGLGAVGGAAALGQRLAGATDAAALAAADAASGAVGGVPCERAAEIAATMGVTVRRCDVDGLVVTVALGASFGLLPATATARAGPPP